MIDRRGFLGGLLAIPSGVKEFVRKISENQVPVSGDLIYQWKSIPVMWTTEMLEDAKCGD